jgi:pescadillo
MPEIGGIELEESELRLAQLQHQLPSNGPGALMHCMEDAEWNDAETRECKNLFKNMKIFLSREMGLSVLSENFAFKLIIYLSCHI